MVIIEFFKFHYIKDYRIIYIGSESIKNAEKNSEGFISRLRSYGALRAYTMLYCRFVSGYFLSLKCQKTLIEFSNCRK